MKLTLTLRNLLRQRRRLSHLASVKLEPDQCPEHAADVMRSWCAREFGYCPKHVNRGAIGFVSFEFPSEEDATLFLMRF